MDKYYRYTLARNDSQAVMEISIDGYEGNSLKSEEQADAEMWSIVADICNTTEKQAQADWYTDNITNPEEDN